MAAHLFKEENEVIQVRESLDGGQDRQAVESSLVEMQLYTRMTRGNTGIFSVAISPREGDTLTPEQQARAIELIEKKFNLDGQTRIRVDHEKSGRFHSHLFWSIVDQENCKLIEISHYKYKLQECAVSMEKEFDIAPVRRTPYEHTIEVTNADRMRDTKERKCQDRKREVSYLWNRSETAEEFLEQIRAAGYEVAKGERSRFVLLDRDGQPYNLVRELPKEVKAKAVTKRFEGLENEFLSVEEAKKQLLDRQQYDREQACIDRTNSELEAADEAGKKKAAQEQEAQKKERQTQKEMPEIPFEIVEQKAQADVPVIAPAYEKFDREREQDAKEDQKRAALKNKLHQFYGYEKMEEDLRVLREKAERANTALGRITGRYSELLDQLEARQKQMANVQQRMNEQFSALEKEIRKASGEQDNKPPAPEPEHPVIDLNAEKERRKEAFKEKERERLRKKAQERSQDRDQGYDI